MTLDDAIAQAAREGRLWITIFPASEGYQVNVSRDQRSWRTAMGADPVASLRDLLGVTQSEPSNAEDLFE